jgi:flagellar protein FlbD
MIKLTRLNNHVVAINPDHIGWADATPDTTLFLIGGEKIIIRETLEELIEHVVGFRRRVRAPEPPEVIIGLSDGDPPRVSIPPRSVSEPPRSTRYSNRPRGGM